MTPSHPTVLNRRQFLVAALTVAGSGAAMTMLDSNTAEPLMPNTDTKTPPVAQGYQETAHTQAYYRVARF